MNDSHDLIRRDALHHMILDIIRCLSVVHHRMQMNIIEKVPQLIHQDFRAQMAHVNKGDTQMHKECITTPHNNFVSELLARTEHRHIASHLHPLGCSRDNPALDAGIAMAVRKRKWHALIASNALSISVEVRLYYFPCLLLVHLFRRLGFTYISIPTYPLTHLTAGGRVNKVQRCFFRIGGAQHHALRLDARHLSRLQIANTHNSSTNNFLERHVCGKSRKNCPRVRIAEIDRLHVQLV
mmetsp:Transcript_49190/g.81684  ORF Transcript_49190/g.81684 Transcript_49190/m.81684 type:complete len:239 (+) Transcript_49190:323-1039(+)